jgi:putative transposase
MAKGTKRRGIQIELVLRTRGGRREGAGRKAHIAGRPQVAHRTRGALQKHAPLLVTCKLLKDVGCIRNRRAVARIVARIAIAKDRFGVRLIEYSIQSDHLHLIVEAPNAAALGRAMKGLSVRIARALNRMLDRRGKVFADRYHHRELSTPRQVRHALAYVLCNARKHRVAPPRAGWLDPCSSAASFTGFGAPAQVEALNTTSARCWLLRVGWRRHGPIDPDHTPGPITN